MVHVQEVLGLQMRVADRAVPPHWVPSRVHALAVDGAGVDGDGGGPGASGSATTSGRSSPWSGVSIPVEFLDTLGTNRVLVG